MQRKHPPNSLGLGHEKAQSSPSTHQALVSCSLSPKPLVRRPTLNISRLSGLESYLSSKTEGNP